MIKGHSEILISQRQNQFKKYLYFFRFQYPIDWININDHEEINFVFINAVSEKDALEWGNRIAERFIEELIISRNAFLQKINFAGVIWGHPDYEFSEIEKEEARNFQIIDCGEYPIWNFEEN